MISSNKYGFSLIELMTVLAIIAVLAAIALPLYLQYLCKAQAMESLNAMRETKYAWAMLRVRNDFNHSSTNYTTSEHLMNTLSVELPTRNWSYVGHDVEANEVSVRVTAKGDLKACLLNGPFQYDYHIVYVPGGSVNQGIAFEVENSSNTTYVKNTN